VLDVVELRELLEELSVLLLFVLLGVDELLFVLLLFDEVDVLVVPFVFVVEIVDCVDVSLVFAVELLKAVAPDDALAVV
jgi:hypothetical protein